MEFITINVIEKAKIACENFGQQVNYHFAEVGKMVEGCVAPVQIQDFQLTRYACYLIAQNAGYKGLYDGKTRQDIAKHKGL